MNVYLNNDKFAYFELKKLNIMVYGICVHILFIVSYI